MIDYESLSINQYLDLLLNLSLVDNSIKPL